jgi:hypothetical protein
LDQLIWDFKRQTGIRSKEKNLVSGPYTNWVKSCNSQIRVVIRNPAGDSKSNFCIKYYNLPSFAPLIVFIYTILWGFKPEARSAKTSSATPEKPLTLSDRCKTKLHKLLTLNYRLRQQSPAPFIGAFNQLPVIEGISKNCRKEITSPSEIPRLIITETSGSIT